MEEFVQAVRSAASQARALSSMPEHKAHRLTIARASEMLSEIEYSARKLSSSREKNSNNDSFITAHHRLTHGQEPRRELGAIGGEAAIDGRDIIIIDGDHELHARRPP